MFGRGEKEMRRKGVCGVSPLHLYPSSPCLNPNFLHGMEAKIR